MARLRLSDIRMKHVRWAMELRDLQDQIRHALKRNGLSPAKASILASGNTSLVKNILRGHMPRVDSLAKLAEALGTSFVIGPPPVPSDFLGESPELKSQVLSVGVVGRLLDESEEALLRSEAVVKALEEHAAAPYAEFITQYEVVHSWDDRPIYLAFRRDWLEAQGLQPADLTLVWMQDDSMAPMLYPQDPVLVDRSHRQLRDGRIVALIAEHGPILCRLHADRGQWLAGGDNSDRELWLPVGKESVVGRAAWWAHTVQIQEA